jgi:hypothetical protein
MWKKYYKIATYVFFVISILLLTGCRQEKETTKKNLTQSNGVTQSQEQKTRYVIENGITFSHASGSYAGTELKVHMKAPAGYTIAFTTNGTIPSGKDASGKSELDVTLNRSMSGYLMDHRELMLCPDFSDFVLLKDDSLPAGVVLNTTLVDSKGTVGNDVQTNVYFLNVDFEKRFPGCVVVSITTDSQNLLDYKTGILTTGAVYDAWRNTEAGKSVIKKKWWWKAEANFTQHGRNWERPCQIQIFDSGSATPMEMNAGLRVRGGMSRGYAQKSFMFYFREGYGDSLLHFPLFGKKEAYQTFSLRNGGNDTDYLKFKDTFIQDLGKGGKFTVFDSRPAVLFLNGEYWGPYSLNEVISGKTMENRFGVEEKNVVVIKEAKVKEGKEEDIRLYEELQAFANKDLTDPEVYRQFCDTVDVRSMADYFAMRIYVGDGDWTPVHNHVLWRSRDKSYNGGRWQYIVHDTEYSAGHYDQQVTSPETDHFRVAIRNFPVFRAAIRNKDFYTMFLKAIKKAGSENYKYSRVQAKMESYDKIWSPLMPDFYKRFGDSSDQRKGCMELTLNFFKKRYDIIIPIMEKWRP